MLAHVYEPRLWSGGPCWVQPKLNGVRALYQMGNFQSRDEMPWNKKVLRHISEVLVEIFNERIILDGELYVHGWKLQEINGAVAINRLEPCEKTRLVEYHVFDQVKFNRPFIDRWRELADHWNVLREGPVRLVQTEYAKTVEEADEFYASAVSFGYEGMMYRVGVCPYTKPSMGRGMSDKNNRTWHLLKRKSWMDEEFECVGVEEGEGKRAGMVGAFVCQITTDLGISPGSHDYLHRTFGVGSGLTDSEATYYFNNPPIGRKIKVKFLCYTKDGIPFNPTVEAVL